MISEIIGNALVLGDNIDTDQIYPGAYLALTDPKEIGKHCLEGVDSTISSTFPAGGIIVAGRNFGCGSSREHAPIAILNMGASAIIADSFARIFFRNAINLGLLPVVCKGASEHINSGQSIRIDLQNNTITNTETGAVLPCEPISPHALRILEAGGIKELMKLRDK